METKDILLVIPPFTQLNCAYPSTAFLNGFLKNNGYTSVQSDLGIVTINALLSSNGLAKLFEELNRQYDILDEVARKMLAQKDLYISLIEPVKTFLQGKDNSLATAFAGNQLPIIKRLDQLKAVNHLFGEAGIHDKAKFKCTLFIEEIGDLITSYIDRNFGFSRYAEHLGIRAHDFKVLKDEVEKEGIITEIMFNQLETLIQLHHPQLIGFSIPFHGNLVAGLKLAKYVKTSHPNIKTVMGGGYVNTELRALKEPGLFHWIDFVVLDDGELPLMQLIDFVKGKIGVDQLVRTFYCNDNIVLYANNGDLKDIPHLNIGPPDYEGIEPGDYLSVLEVANPMHRLWTDGWWNKLMLAHGCYWHQCSFCDTSLDYISRYSMANAAIVCNWIEKIIQQTGRRGFHFVDEAAPPALLKSMAIELLKRKIRISWWANIRFDEAFTADTCQLLAASGCIAVSGGLETASDRLLQLMKKGVSIEQVSQVTRNFSRSGILVHAYLMYGFPTQSVQETIDSLEIVRQLFANGLIQSAYWHRFALTIHSPVYHDPQKFKIKIKQPPVNAFALNDADYDEEKPIDHEAFGYGLQKAVYNYMHGQCFDFKTSDWFDFKTPKTTHLPNLIKDYISVNKNLLPDKNQRVLWLGGNLLFNLDNEPISKITLPAMGKNVCIDLKGDEKLWLQWLLKSASFESNKLSYELIGKKYKEFTHDDFEYFTTTKPWKILRQNGLIFV